MCKNGIKAVILSVLRLRAGEEPDGGVDASLGGARYDGLPNNTRPEENTVLGNTQEILSNISRENSAQVRTPLPLLLSRSCR